FDCFSGISGDMTIGALLDLGLDFGYLKTELGKLPVEGYELKMSRVIRSNISATKFDVLVEGTADHHDHHGHDHGHDHGHEHSHHHDHEHSHGKHSHFHRKASEILAMIAQSNLSAGCARGR